ncbi:MAG: ribosome-binding factor A, partial [Anaerolineaceae bacterium]|nr:ribosome-binding factor A [Anaerolineaceae bacterium]
SKEVLDGLHSASSFLRRTLAARVDLRVFPRLRFHWDPTPEKADHIERILASLRASEAATPTSSLEEEDDDGSSSDETSVDDAPITDSEDADTINEDEEQSDDE